VQNKSLIPVDKKQKKEHFVDIQEHSQSVGIQTVETKVFMSHELANDVTTYASLRSFQLALFELPLTSKANVGMRNSIDIRMNIDTDDDRETPLGRFSSQVTGNIDKLFNLNDPTSRIISYALQNLESPIGILMHRESGNAFEMKKVLVAFNSQDLERLSLFNVLRRIPNSVVVTVFASDVSNIRDAMVQGNNVTLVQNVNPVGNVLEEAERGYDLVILSSSRKTSLEFCQSDVVQKCPCDVLVIYPPMTEIQKEMKASPSGSPSNSTPDASANSSKHSSWTETDLP